MSDKFSLQAQSPYFDDFDPAKDYLQVLFRPGYPVQARELTTLQTFLQQQVARLGDNFYREGSIVKGAEIAMKTDVHVLTLLGTSSTLYPSSGAGTASVATIKDLVGTIISNESGTVKARVLPTPTGTESTTTIGEMYIQYITAETFDSEGGYIYATTTDNDTLTSLLYNTFETTSAASMASIAEGFYYIFGRFVAIQEQNIVIPNTHSPSVEVGLTIFEEAVTQNDDTSLFDNARGSTNEGAPGAHRLKVNADLTYKNQGTPADSTFYRMASFRDGVRQEINDISATVSLLNEVLARRTYDESGDYALKPFTPTVYASDSDRKFVIELAPSKAYVKGYEIEKTAPTRIEMDSFSSTNIVRNFAKPIVGTTSVTVTGVTGELPGSTSGSPMTSTNRLQLVSGGNVVGVARGWAIQNEFKKGEALKKLYLYDIRMFTIIEPSSATFATNTDTGNDVYSGRAHGYAYKEEGNGGVVNGIAVVGATGKFHLGKEVKSDVSSETATIIGVTPYQLSDVTSITAANGFSATVTAGSIENANGSLYIPVAKNIKTLKDASTVIMDNDFEVLENTGATATSMDSANGFYDTVRVNDSAEITKQLRFGYMKISVSGAGVNYGWSAAHKEVSLHYPDVYKVYQVNETAASNFADGAFTQLSITTAGVIPQGSIVRGATSGTEAIVALENANNINQVSLAGIQHQTRTGTGASSTLEVVFTKGSAFTVGENLEVVVPGTETAYTYQVTMNGTTAEVGANINSAFMLDDGQRGEYYDIGRLVRKYNVPAPNNDIIVFFSYFEADPSTAHYYSVDSYSNEDFFRIDQRFTDEPIPVKPTADDVGFELRNGFDFRLRNQAITDTTASPFNFNSRNFATQDRIKPGSLFTTDLEEYYGRIAAITLQKSGEVLVVEGVPAGVPSKPQVSEDGMLICYAHIDPVVRHPETDVIIEKVDNRRYTMRDIGKLEQRIDRVEAAVALNALEIQALNDDIDGRTKSGFIVAAFDKEKGDEKSIADEKHDEFNATIDIINKQLIPGQTDGIPVDMDITAKVNVSEFFPGFLMNAFTEEAFSTQLNATTSQRINPFATWTWAGDVKLDPSEDHWRIRKDDYFTSLYGQLKPFDGDAAAFNAFNRITTRSPGGVSTAVTEWIGAPTTKTVSSAPHTVPDWSGGRFRPGTLRQLHTTTTTQAARTTTTTKFNKPRATGEVTTTKTGSEVIQNPGDYWMRSLTVSFTAQNLKPFTTHDVKFGSKVLGTTTTDANGDASGSFVIPAQTFKAGTQNVEITDQKGGFDSSGFSSFTSIGHLDTYRNVSKTATSVVSNGAVTNKTLSSSRRFTDPIAQMFTLPMLANSQTESSIITSVDLWFSVVDTRPNMNTVKVEIRETVNGYPGGPSAILGESSYIPLTSVNETSSITDATATNIKFNEPIILKDGVEYAIVVKSPSEKMSLYVAQMGENLIDGTAVHSSQPNVGGYFGSFFSSQNASTWTAEQSKDMTYRLKRAKFDTDKAGSITLINTISDDGYFRGDIGAYNQGLSMETFLNCDYVKVYHPNHGLHYNNAQVTISGVQDGTWNGISSTLLNATHTVVYATLDSYFIRVAGTYATADGLINTGTFTTFATQDLVYDALVTNVMAQKNEQDTVRVALKTAQTNSVSLVAASNKIANEAIGAVTRETSYTEIDLDRVVEFDGPRIIRSATNTGAVDLSMMITLQSGGAYTSPIIRTNNNLNPIIFRNITGNLLVDSDLEGLITTASTTDDDTAQEFVSRVQAIQSETEHSAFVTKKVDLEIPADGLTIKLDADMEPSSYAMFAYKAKALGDNTPFEDLEWIDFPYAQQITELNYGDFSSDPDNKAYTLRVDVPYDFSAFKLRIRMGTENESMIPRLANLRIIADV